MSNVIVLLTILITIEIFLYADLKENYKSPMKVFNEVKYNGKK